jgi:hypothetical protein
MQVLKNQQLSDFFITIMVLIFVEFEYPDTGSVRNCILIETAASLGKIRIVGGFLNKTYYFVCSTGTPLNTAF